MEPRIFSPTSPSGTILGSSFDRDRSISFSHSEDSLCALLPSHDSSDSVFDAYISDMVAKDSKSLLLSPTPTLTPPVSGRSSLEEPLMDDSLSQTTITQAAVRSDSARLKKKRSLGQALKTLRSSSRDLTATLRGTKHVPYPLQLEDTSILTVGSETLPGSTGVRATEEDDGFEDRNRTVRRRNMPHHPFRSEDVPYMQAYNQMSLENDFQTHQLLCRLKPSDSPTFHKFGKKPPADVLDLGCGEGFWVLHAAKLWKSHNTRVTGLDLIDVHNNHVGEVHPNLEPAQPPKNVTWLRANFVKYALPFPDNSFDLVQMANLTLCIPMSRWNFVLTQVRRVLRPNGRLELIDDDLFFPSVLPRSARDSPPSPSRRQWKRTPSGSSTSASSRASSLARSLSHKALPDPPPALASPDRQGAKGHARKPSDVEFSTNATVSRHIEKTFENMLQRKYGISPRPHQFLEQVLRDVFGSDCARQTQKLELAVPSRELTENCEAQGLGLGVNTNTGSTISYGHSKRASEDEKKPQWMSIDWEKKEKWSRPSSPVPIAISLPSSSPASTYSGRSSEDSVRSLDLKLDPQLASLTPKARQLLFGEGENVHRGKSPSWRAIGPYQPPGLVLLPSTLIPCSPLELEMHACKHMNTLLACKYALEKYIAGQKDDDGQPLLSEREVDDYLWDYDCFRRKRFNWPQDIPGLQMEEEPEEPTFAPPPTKSTIFNKFAPSTPPATEPQRTLSSGGLGAPVYGGVSVSRQSSTHVRTIHVYEALKVHHHCSCHGSCNGSS